MHRVFIGLPLVWLAMDAGEQEERAEVEENHPGRHHHGEGGVDDGDGGVDDSDGGVDGGVDGGDG